MNKNAIKKFAIGARNRLIASVTDRAGMLGITPEGCSDAISKGTGFEVYQTAAGTEVTLNQSQYEHREKLEKQIKARGFEAVIEEVAYTWFNRICAIRFMEVNDYMYPARVRVLSSEKEGKNEPDIVTEAPEIDLGFTEQEKGEIIEHKISGDTDWLFRILFIKQCNKLSEILPELFEATEDYTEMLFHVSYTNQDDVIQMLIGEGGIPEDDFNIQVSGQVEIIGWLYQYYNEERKNEVINIYKGTVKKEDIPAATQLFTTDWVVRYMVDNSLGRYWIERNPQSKLREKLEFFVMPKSDEMHYIDEKIDPTELTFLDPCMGSGHILVYAFDVLMEIYRECGYSDRDAAFYIVQNNLFGLDLDKRAYQIAYFAVMMKARSYNRRVLTQGICHNLCEIWESNEIHQFAYEGITFDKEQDGVGQYLIDCFKNAKELGSLIAVENRDYKAFAEYLLHLEPEGQIDVFQDKWNTAVQALCLHLAKQADILSKKYYVVATNPPYLGKMQGELKKFVTGKYKDYSGDLFSVFMYRNFDFCVKNGYSAFMTPFVWMFIKTYEKLREYIIENKSITTLVQMEYSAFEEATVPICSFVLQNGKVAEKSLCIRLSDFKGGMEVQKHKVLEVLGDGECDYFYEAEQDNFSKIPGSPVAYWAAKTIFNIFEISKCLNKFFEVRNGITTGNNSLFLRLWYEVSSNSLKWVSCNKGGSFRKWNGNREFVVNWENDGYCLKTLKNDNGKLIATLRGIDFNFTKGITMSRITSGKPSFRIMYSDSISESATNAIYPKNENIIELLWVMGLLNSIVGQYILQLINPTINIVPDDLRNIPIKKGMENLIIKYVDSNMCLSKDDWDFFETSWDFKRHPLLCSDNRMYLSWENSGKVYSQEEINAVPFKHYLKLAYESWELECENRFQQLKSNEEELNRIFIDIYGLQDELTPEVEDKDVTVRKADLQRDIRSLLSYAVGCMFGRYSLDVEGLAYAGGDWDSAKYTSFIPDDDNIIPITDEEYFSDDIVGRFYEWLKVVYGEDTLEENLDFIAQALGNKGDTSREVIRNYFLTDFIKDHIKIYQKRPIYWLFDSGKANGFKALIYMHRYHQDTVGTVRTEYLHKSQKAIEQAMKRAEYIRDNGSGSEKAKATKLITRYTKQLAEIHTYDQAIAHIANQRIAIDLDDGVKINYAKFQGVEVAQEGKKAIKVNLLAKI